MALLPKLRFLSPVISAAGGISWKYFLLVNSIATAVNITIYILLGIFFHNQLSRLLHQLSFWQNILLGGVMLGLSIFIFILIKRSVMKTN